VIVPTGHATCRRDTTTRTLLPAVFLTGLTYLASPRGFESPVTAVKGQVSWRSLQTASDSKRINPLAPQSLNKGCTMSLGSLASPGTHTPRPRKDRRGSSRAPALPTPRHPCGSRPAWSQPSPGRSRRGQSRGLLQRPDNRSNRPRTRSRSNADLDTGDLQLDIRRVAPSRAMRCPRRQGRLGQRCCFDHRRYKELRTFPPARQPTPGK
jgi:hypothetical protein